MQSNLPVTYMLTTQRTITKERDVMMTQPAQPINKRTNEVTYRVGLQVRARFCRHGAADCLLCADGSHSIEPFRH